MFRRPSLKYSTSASQVKSKAKCHTTDSIPAGTTNTNRSSIEPRTAIYYIHPDQSLLNDEGTFERVKDTFNWVFTSRGDTPSGKYTLRGKAFDTPTSIGLPEGSKIFLEVWREPSLGDHINFVPSEVPHPHEPARQEHEHEEEGGIYGGLKVLFSPKTRPAETFDSFE
ncbi:hypothetical protein I302_101095 [Kwoniella bestiolae CBS 10118]|uniref:Uncharacterized protein n=1 Tax=Kwoniella bestiolae CBS 10118 TaxID=1296100 RepID=A0A1B9G711_9TREE|nr:hypothetical protein I302_04470 [Kwoniella bestiolae CBS 10118]OCF26781.1 hypothetical protein I302_04470 [Kwoniella bestiolae CBS 10118]